MTVPRKLPVRPDRRYSAALTLRAFRRMLRRGTALFRSNAEIRRAVREDKELCF